MIRVIVVDDEQPSLNKLVKLLENSGLAEVKGKFLKPLDALEFLKENKADTVFLDIEMPDVNGMELSSRIIDLQEGINIVFVTAYNQYAVEAFHLNALDYLMKPVSVSRLNETLNKILAHKGIGVHSGGLDIRCFGRFGVSAGGEQVKFRTEKAEELLALMIDKRGSFISRSEIIDTLWPDFDGDRALIHFNTTLHYVRKALLQYSVRIPFTYDGGGYKFDMDGMNCDYLRFCTFVEKGKIAERENIQQFEEAADLFTGEYLAGWEYNWAAVKRLRLEEQFIDLILKISEYYKQTGSLRKSAEWLKEGLIREPLNREVNYRLVEVLMAANECIYAVKYYEIYRNGLMNQFGREPDKSFIKFYDRLSGG